MVLLSDNILRCLSPEDRERYAKGQLTSQEAAKKGEVRQEKELHKLYESWLGLHDLDYCHPRMDAPTTIKKGIADFHVWRGIFHCFIEFKTEHGKLSPEQVQFQSRQLALGTPSLVTTSYEEACEFTLKSLFPALQETNPNPSVPSKPSPATGKPLVEVFCGTPDTWS